MENETVLQRCIRNEVTTTDHPTIMILQPGQAENVLQSISAPPPPPEYLVNDETMLLPATHTNDEVTDQVPADQTIIPNDNHEPPGELNSTQQHVYQICSEYLSYESRRRQNML